MKNELHIILPTHRKNNFEELVGSIIKQNSYPKSLNLIIDNYKLDTELESKLELYCNKHQIIYKVYYSSDLPYRNNTALDAFKNCIYIIKLIILNTVGNPFFQILEDDVKIIKNNYLKRIDAELDTNTKLIMVNLLDTIDHNHLDGKKLIKSGKSIYTEFIGIIDYTNILVDTCGLIFNLDIIEVNYILTYLNSKKFCLNGDIYLFVILLYYCKITNSKFVKFEGYEISSLLHRNQISINFGYQKKDTGYFWRKDLTKSIRIIGGNYLKHEQRMQSLYSILCTLIEMEYFDNIDNNFTNYSLKKDFVRLQQNKISHIEFIFIHFSNIKNIIKNKPKDFLAEVGLDIKTIKTLYPNKYKYIMEILYEK